jgi:acyl-CoA synthetase (AMP-forming)/AMP-acid ligase II
MRAPQPDAPAHGLLTLVQRALPAPVRVHFVPSGECRTLARLWDDAAVAARRLDGLVGPEAPVAAVLDSTPEAVAVLLGAWRAGRRLVSVPQPPRAASADWYRRFVERACRASGAGVLVVSAEHRSRDWPPGVPVAAFEDIAAGAPGGTFAERPDDGELVQFTSGSTGDPRGLVLGMAELGANVRAVLEVTEPRPGDGTCTWLPLSHDMGLIGNLLASLVSFGPDHAGGGDLVLIRPEWFLQRPESWLEACSEFGSTVTAAPDFGFAHAVRRGVTRPVDLRRLRMAITGAEPVRAPTLRAFADAFAPAGFAERALCPAYGLAEAGVAVTMVRPDEPWRTLDVDGEEHVSCGRPLPGYTVAAGPGGTLELTGPSLFRATVPGGPRTGDRLVTNDVGVVHDGEVFVVGRADDVVVLGGRNVYLSDVDTLLAASGAVRAGRVQSVPAPGGYAVAAETAPGADAGALATAVRRAAVAATGWSPDEVVVVERGSLPRTASGKARRRELARGLAAGDLPVAHRWARRP